MSLELYGPPAALIALALLTVISFLWVRALMGRAAPQAGPAVEDAPPAPPFRPEQSAHAPSPSAVAHPVPEFAMAAPVELWFGETRVAVRAGSETERRFLGFGAALLEELGDVRGST